MTLSYILSIALFRRAHFAFFKSFFFFFFRMAACSDSVWQANDGHRVDSDGPFIVFGANGFLGSEICIHLRKRNRWATIVAPCRAGSGRNPRLADLRIDFVEVGDVPTEDDLTKCLNKATSTASHDASDSKIAGVFHVAGDSTFSDAAEDVERMRLCNVTLTETIFKFAVKHNLRTVYASCAAVVGCQYLEHADRIAHDDDDCCGESINYFAHLVQKREIEERWHEEAMKGRAPLIFIRPTTLFGPGDEQMRSTKPLLDILNGLGAFPLHCGGISFCDVRDVAAAFVRAMVGYVPGGSALNVTACNLPYHEFVTLVEQTLRISATSLVPYRFTPSLPAWFHRSVAAAMLRARCAFGMPLDEFQTKCYAESRLRFYNVTCQRAKLLLHWDPRDLEETIEDTARYLVRTLGSHEAHHRLRTTKLSNQKGVQELAGVSRRRVTAKTSAESIRSPRRWKFGVWALLFLLILAYVVVS